VTAAVRLLRLVPHPKEKYLTILQQLQGPSEGGRFVPNTYFLKIMYILSFVDVACTENSDLFGLYGLKYLFSSVVLKLFPQRYSWPLLLPNQVEYAIGLVSNGDNTLITIMKVCLENNWHFIPAD
jgi:hypothetical protein